MKLMIVYFLLEEGKRHQESLEMIVVLCAKVFTAMVIIASFRSYGMMMLEKFFIDCWMFKRSVTSSNNAQWAKFENNLSK